VDEEEKLQGKSQVHPAVAAAASVNCNFEDSFDDAILASIPLDELSKCDKGSVEIIYEGGLSQIVDPPKVLAKNKSMELRTEHIGTKRPLERHQSLPQQPLANSTNGKKPLFNLAGNFHPNIMNFSVLNSANGHNVPKKCTKEEIEAKKRAAQQRLAQSRQRAMRR
jgi:hypothetical protein